MSLGNLKSSSVRMVTCGVMAVAGLSGIVVAAAPTSVAADAQGGFYVERHVTLAQCQRDGNTYGYYHAINHFECKRESGDDYRNLYVVPD